MNDNNPLLKESTAPFGAPEFDKIKTEDYKRAFETALAEAKASVRNIADNSDEPDFFNTVEALERSGETLAKIEGLFFNLNEACTDSIMQRTAEEISPSLTGHMMSILLNGKLFNKVKSVYDKRDGLNLSQEQARLLENTYRSFIRNGANLPEDKKEELSKIEEELSLTSLKFGKNVLSATNAFTLEVTDESLLSGLPGYVKDAAACEASQRGLEGWVFTLNAPSYSPFMKFSSNRELREKMWRAYNSKCIGGEFDNTGNVLRLSELRMKEARILGYQTYADYSLEDKMAKNPSTVDKFLKDLLDKSMPFARRDVKTVQDFAAGRGFEGALMPWDFSYWAEKYRERAYSLNEEQLKPYFELDSVQNALFFLAGKLYGLKFIEHKDIPVYHPDVRVFEVTDETSEFKALLYMDYFPRESKRSGAWMTAFREESVVKGIKRRPFISIVTNFTKPTEDTPSLLTFDEVTTILHEFGHALHGILAEGTYSSLSGTNVARDFVELPSQIMENWAYEPDYLKTFARHYLTGEVIPQEFIDRIVEARNYLSGYSNVRQLCFAITDMAWHTLDAPALKTVVDFEQDHIKDASVLPQVDGIVFSPSFNHIFSGGYSAGYYSYKWAEVLEADAFSQFKKKGIFSRETASAFRDKILSRGNIEDADVLYRNFMGRDPDSNALLEKLGLK